MRDTYTVTPAGASQPSFSEALRYRGSQVGQVVVSGTATTPFTQTFLHRPDGAPLELLNQPQGQRTKRYWYLLDGRNNVVGLVDASGTVQISYNCDVWAKPTSTNEQPSLHQPLRYGGYWYDGWDYSLSAGTWNSGPLPWYWLTVRGYDPALRRFLQPDPATRSGLPDYVYADDDPLDVSDPSGQAGGPAGCAAPDYCTDAAHTAGCEQQAQQQQDQARRMGALWAVPNGLLLNPLGDLVGPNRSVMQRFLGALALAPFAGWPTQRRLRR